MNQSPETGNFSLFIFFLFARFRVEVKEGKIFKETPLASHKQFTELGSFDCIKVSHLSIKISN